MTARLGSPLGMTLRGEIPNLVMRFTETQQRPQDSLNNLARDQAPCNRGGWGGRGERGREREREREREKRDTERFIFLCICYCMAICVLICVCVCIPE